MALKKKESGKRKPDICEKPKRKGDLFTVEFISLILGVIAVSTLFFGCAKYNSSNIAKGIDKFSEFTDLFSNINDGQQKSIVLTIESGSAIVIWTKDTKEITLSVLGKEFSFVRPSSCSDIAKTCACYLDEYDLKTKVSKQYKCSYLSYYVADSKTVPFEIIAMNSAPLAKSDRKKLVSAVSYLSDTSKIPSELYSIKSGQNGVVIDRKLTNSYTGKIEMILKRVGNEMIVCYSQQSCDHYESLLTKDVDIKA